MRRVRFDRGNAARVPAMNNIDNFIRKRQFNFPDDFMILDNIHGRVRVKKSQLAQVEIDDIFNFDNVFAPENR